LDRRARKRASSGQLVQGQGRKSEIENAQDGRLEYRKVVGETPCNLRLRTEGGDRDKLKRNLV